MTTFHSWLAAVAGKYAGRPAINFEGRSTSYDDVLRASTKLANGMRALGVTADDHVALVMTNSLECVHAWFATWILGCTEIPINPQYRGDLLRYLMSDSGTTVVICDDAHFEQVKSVAGSLTGLRTVIVNGGAYAPQAEPSPFRTFAYEEVSRSGADEISPVTGASERVILYTSGTTGPSKGVIHTHKSCLTLAHYNAEMLEYGESDRLLNFFPLYHQNARYTGVIPALSVGASIRLERRLKTAAFWDICDADGITAFNYLGSVLRMILNVTPPERVAGRHTIRKAFGAGATPLLWAEFQDRLGIDLVEVYGLTEAPMATVNSPRRRSAIGSAGRASDLFEVQVVDADDMPVAVGSIGEIVMRPRRADAVMLGYHNKDAATVHAFRNLWFHSGDRGRLTADGDLYFEEREKDSIRRRGENISAWEVESTLDQHPDVAESAVYGLPSVEADEEVCAAMVLRAGSADLSSIIRFAEERLPRYAVPTLLRIVTELPRTATAKVQKAELRGAGRTGCVVVADLLRRATSG